MKTQWIKPHIWLSKWICECSDWLHWVIFGSVTSWAMDFFPLFETAQYCFLASGRIFWSENWHPICVGPSSTGGWNYHLRIIWLAGFWRRSSYTQIIEFIKVQQLFSKCQIIGADMLEFHWNLVYHVVTILNRICFQTDFLLTSSLFCRELGKQLD